MKTKDLIKALLNHTGKKVLLASDEELNTIYSDIRVSEAPSGEIIIYGLTGSEVFS